MRKTASIHRVRVTLWLSLGGAAWVLAMWLAGDVSGAHEATVTSLLSSELSHDASKELSLVAVDYPPGGSTTAHIHQAQALIYVLEGSIEMQVRGAPVTLSPGQTWYEGPHDVHIVSRNASNARSAKYLVFMVKDKSAPILTCSYNLASSDCPD
jgi:quercetin dioxygenase-like cupin family protein